MAKSSTLTFTQSVNFAGVTYTNSDSAATVKTLYTAGSNDAVVKGIAVRSDDSSNRTIDLIVYDGATNYYIGNIQVLAGSGSNGSASTDALSSINMPGLPVDATNKKILPMKAGHLLKVSNQAQVTSGKTITITAFIEEY